MDILEQARVEWFAAAFGIVVGIAMVFVPYEFGAAMFQYIYPHIRLLGSLFLVGSAMMLVALMYPAGPPSWEGWAVRSCWARSRSTGGRPASCPSASRAPSSTCS
ncbi:hypothetical protein ACN28S_40845 [Cystobacter fuscus]